MVVALYWVSFCFNQIIDWHYTGCLFALYDHTEYLFVVWHSTEWQFTECEYVKCHSVEWHSNESHSKVCQSMFLSDIQLNAILLHSECHYTEYHFASIQSIQYNGVILYCMSFCLVWQFWMYGSVYWVSFYFNPIYCVILYWMSLCLVWEFWMYGIKLSVILLQYNLLSDFILDVFLPSMTILNVLHYTECHFASSQSIE